MSESVSSHRAAAEAVAEPVHAAVLTVSDTRDAAGDTSGARIVEMLLAARHHVVHREIVRDEPDDIRARLRPWLSDPEVQLVLITGGTGLSRRDRTVEVVRPMLRRELEGFGELFRILSFREIGAAAMMSRAVGGLIVDEAGGDTFVFALPGSRHAVEMAMSRLILPELNHLLWSRG